MEYFEVPREQQLFKNIVYVGALAAILDIELDVIKNIIAENFSRKEKLIPSQSFGFGSGF